MHQTKWENLVFNIEEKFGIDKKYTEDFEVHETPEGNKIMGKKEIIEFVSPLGKIKLERTSRPRVVDKKVLHTKRIGGKVAVDFVYSPDQMVYGFKAYKKADDNEWEELSADTLGI